MRQFAPGKPFILAALKADARARFDHLQLHAPPNPPTAAAMAKVKPSSAERLASTLVDEFEGMRAATVIDANAFYEVSAKTGVSIFFIK